LIPFDDSPEVDNWAFARNKNVNEIYVLLLEKAIAKVFGSYEAIESSKPNQALQMLTGFPSDLHVNKKSNFKDLWDCIVEANGDRGMAIATVNMKVLGINSAAKQEA
jgi:hypothetical protein